MAVVVPCFRCGTGPREELGPMFLGTGGDWLMQDVAVPCSGVIPSDTLCSHPWSTKSLLGLSP